MPVGAWSPPVVVRAGKGGEVRWTVSDAAKAAELMLKHWPKRAPIGPANVKARKTLLRCLEGKCYAQKARQAFIEAAEEAGIRG